MGNDRLLNLWAARPLPGGSVFDRENRQWEVAGIAGTSTPSPATSDWGLDVSCQVLLFIYRYNGQRPGAFAPSPGWPPDGTGDATCRLLQLGSGAGGLEVLLQLLGLV